MNKKSYSFDFRKLSKKCFDLSETSWTEVCSISHLLRGNTNISLENLDFPGNIKLLSDFKVIRYLNLGETFGKQSSTSISVAVKLYHDLATGKGATKTKICNVDLQGTSHDEHQAFLQCKRVKATAKVAKSGKKKQPALGLETLSDIALTEAEQMKLAIERSKTQLHISQPSGSGAHEGTGVTPGVPDVPTYESDDEQISWKSSEEEDDDEENVSEHEDDDDDERTEFDNDGDYFVYPKFSTHDDEARQEEEVNEEDSFDPRVQTPSHVESTDDDNNDDEIQSANVNNRVLLCHLASFLTCSTLDQIQVLTQYLLSYIEANLLVAVLVTTIAEPTFVFAISLPHYHSVFTHMQQTPVSTPTTVPSSSLQDLPNFGSFFRFDHRLKTLEINFSEFKQTNQFDEAVSSILGIVDAYLANKMNEVVKTVVQLQSDRLRDEAQAENEDFLNKLDENIKKIIKDQVKEQVKAQVSKILPRIEKTVNEQLEDEVMTRSSIESKISLAIAANLSELELKKILIEKMESNKSIHGSNEQKNLYKALVEAYKTDKLILDTYGGLYVSFKGRRGSPSYVDEDKAKNPPLESTGVPKDDELEKEPGVTSLKGNKTSKTTGQVNEWVQSQHSLLARATEEQSDEETSQHPNWFQKPAKIPTPDRDWNKTLPAVHGPVQPWLSNLAQEEGPRESFDELMNTPLDFNNSMGK
ncbi:hypothetical protein Tco_0980265 [Tanacetum coccineum]